LSGMLASDNDVSLPPMHSARELAGVAAD
jgi:hypothetical protein